VLTGLLKRARKDAEVISVSDIESVKTCADRLRGGS